MNERRLKKIARTDAPPLAEAAIVEISILLESSLLPVLEAAAHDEGRTAGVLIRRLIRDFLGSSHGGPSAAKDAAATPHPQDAMA